MTAVLGRTNWAAPPVWFAPVCDRLEDAAVLLDALPKGSVVALNGPVVAHACRGRDIVRLVDLGFAYETAANASHAADLVSADLLQVMALAGTATGLLVTLPVRTPLWGGQVEGALRALEGARDDGIVRHLGVRVAGPWAMVEPTWRRHDGFEFAVCPPETAEEVLSFASGRRVGVVVSGTRPGAYRLVRISSLAEMSPFLAPEQDGP